MAGIRRRKRDNDQQADVSRFAALLMIVILLILVLGLVGLPGQIEEPRVLVRIFMSVLAAAILLATIRVARMSRRHERLIVSITGVVMLVAIVGSALTSNPSFGKAATFLWVLLVISAPVLVLRQVLASDEVTVQTILGSITVYLLVGVSLTLVAIAMEGTVGFFETTPRPTAYVYFAFVTITSLGYGDLSPYTDGARMVSILAAVISQMYLVIVVARLVSIWSPSLRRSDRDDER